VFLASGGDGAEREHGVTAAKGKGVGKGGPQRLLAGDGDVVDAGAGRIKLGQVGGRRQVLFAQGEDGGNCLDCAGGAEQVTVHYQDLDGKARSFTADGLLAVCVQHELDHLNGKVFVDHLSQLKQGRIKNKLAKQARVTA